MMGKRAGAALAAAAIAVSCAPRPAPPVPTPPPPPLPAPPPAPLPGPPPAADWQAAPLTPGDWTMAAGAGAPAAIYGDGGAIALRIACGASGRIALFVPGSEGAGLTIRTSFGERRVAGAALPGSDPLLDQIAFSRGRFLVQPDGGPALIVPSWPEPARVIESCRGQ